MSHPRAVLGLLTAALLALTAVAAPAQTADDDSFSLSFSTTKRKAPSGFQVEAEFPRQRIIDQLVVSFPPGTKFDTGVAAQCNGDTQTIAAAGGPSEVCPPDSRIGTGTGQAFIGDNPEPLSFDLVVFNRRKAQIIDIRAGGASAFTTTGRIKGRKLTIGLGLAPEINARITAFAMDVGKQGSKRRPYLRTPATCPRSKQLTASITARENGAGSETTKDKVPCRR